MSHWPQYLIIALQALNILAGAFLGRGKITVTTPGGTASSATSFTVIPVPTITSLTPSSGPVGSSVAVAVALQGGLDFPEGARVGVILSGGNVDLAAYAGFLAQA